MAVILSYLAAPAMFWGFCGAFIYAGPRWVISLSTVRELKNSIFICTLEMFMALVVGVFAAAAFSGAVESVALTTLHLKDDNAICAVIGLFANRYAPVLVESGTRALDSGATIVGRVLKALKGDEK